MTNSAPSYDIPFYETSLPPELLAEATKKMRPVPKAKGLLVDPSLSERFAKIETDDALAFVVELYERVRPSLKNVLAQRLHDREFLQKKTSEAVKQNQETGADYHSSDYKTAIGVQDDRGRVVLGPLSQPQKSWKPVNLPKFLQTDPVTLFGPPDTKKMSINAMNAWHRRLSGENPIVEKLLSERGHPPMWGADNEDSKTPVMSDFLLACENLIECFDKTIRFEEPGNGKVYELAESQLSQPIKRFPGLAIPDGSHVLNGSPLPLHLYDFGMHLFHNWKHPEALCFYVPKLENEEEAAYLRELISTAEEMLRARNPNFEVGSVRVILVFETPRAIFRINEMAEALHPYFAGGSLGWHDFLASTAKLFQKDPNYRIPVKADPNIVINHIKESHVILSSALGQIGALKLGGMYGVLYEESNEASFEVSIIGFIKDVVSQLKRGLDGFWVAHPSFVRIGLALVAAWKKAEEVPGDQSLRELIGSLVSSKVEFEKLMAFVNAEDVPGLSSSDPLYARSVIAADLKESEVIANHDLEEVRYNVFQALQYLADWLTGNGCVALPATMKNGRGETVFIRVMDDLATTERSRWEVWAEIQHGRVSLEDFEKILEEEIAFVKENQATPTKRVQVPWQGEAAKWYPVAIRILKKLMTDPHPPDSVTEVILPFAQSCVREASDPLKFFGEVS